MNFFDDIDDLLKEDNPKPARKEIQRASTTMEFNLKPHFNNDSSELPKSSSYSNRFQQGQYNSSQVNFFSGVQDDNNTDEETHKKFGMTGMTIQTTISKNDDAQRQYEPPKSAGSPQVGANFRKTFADIGSLEEKDDDEFEMPVSRRNIRRQTYKDQTTTNQDNGDRFKGSTPAFGGLQMNTGIGKKDNLNQLSQLDELEGSSMFQQGNKTSFGGSIQIDKGSKQPNAQEKKNQFGYQESDDGLEELGGYNPSSVSRVASASARRTRQRETNSGSSPNSMTNTKVNNQQSFSAQEPQQQYPRLLKQPEDQQAQITNDSGANRIPRNQQVGRNESSYISDKEYLGASETKEIEIPIDNDEFHIENKYSRRSSSHRGADNSKQSQPPKPNQISNQQQENLTSQQQLLQAQPSFQQQIQSQGSVSQQSFPQNNQQDVKTNEAKQIEANAKETLKMLKQLEEEKKSYKEQLQKESEENLSKLRKTYEEQIEAIKESYEDMLKFERQRNSQQQTEVQELIKKDRERQRQLNEKETDNLKKLFEKEKEQIEAGHNLEIQSLKKLLQKQSETSALEGQLKMNSDKLATIQNQIEGAVSKNQVDMHAQIEETQEKQRYLNDLEKTLQLQREILEADKKRVEKQKAHLTEFAESQREQLTKEKEVVLQEYKRINELQEQIKELEAEKKKENFNERKIIEADRLECQEERLRLKQEYEQLYRNFEARVEAFEKTKVEFQKGQGKIDSFQENRVRAVEGRHMDVLKQEQYVMKKMKALELRELELNRREQEEAIIFARAKEQQITCEMEKQSLLNLAQDIKTESKMAVDFRSNFQLEQTKLLQKEQELQDRERQINKRQSQVLSEKREVSLLHQTLRELKQQQILSSTKPQINYTSPSAKSFSDYQSSQTSFQFRSPRLKTTTNNMFKSPEYKTLNTRSANNLKQFNFGAIDVEDTQESHRNDLNDYCKGQSYNRFDIRGFMNDVKELDRKQIDNINYISHEKDNLLSCKMIQQRIPTFSMNEFINDEVDSQFVASVHDNNSQRQSISNFFGAQR